MTWISKFSKGGVEMQRKHISSGAVAALVVCIIVVLFVAGLFVINWIQPTPAISLFDAEQYYQDATPPPAPPPQPPPVGKPDPAPPTVEDAPTMAASPDIDHEKAPEYIITSVPVRMRIPALSLDYEVQGTGADERGTMQIVPSLEVISWFRLSSIPGNRGNAILGGHNTWSGVRSRIFSLDELEIGDEMIIDYADGTSVTFRLESVFVYLLRTAPADLIMDVRGDARVTLITCKWPFNTVTGTSDNRIVATFKESHGFVIPDPPIEPFPPRELA